MKPQNNKENKHRCLGCFMRDKIIEQLRSDLEVERTINSCGWERAAELEEKLKALQPDNILGFDRSQN